MKTIFLASAVLTVASGWSDASAMASYRWKYRPLLVFADSASNAALAQQRATVAAGRAGLASRNVVVVWVVANTVTSQLGPLPGQSAASLRARFAVPSTAFKVVLVGKDGGAKLTRDGPIGAAQLFSTIDAMPMRRDEMRGK